MGSGGERLVEELRGEGPERTLGKMLSFLFNMLFYVLRSTIILIIIELTLNPLEERMMTGKVAAKAFKKMRTKLQAFKCCNRLINLREMYI